jgi:hypothetical protein
MTDSEIWVVLRIGGAEQSEGTAYSDQAETT